MTTEPHQKRLQRVRNEDIAIWTECQAVWVIPTNDLPQIYHNKSPMKRRTQVKDIKKRNHDMHTIDKIEPKHKKNCIKQ